MGGGKNTCQSYCCVLDIIWQNVNSSYHSCDKADLISMVCWFFLVGWLFWGFFLSLFWPSFELNDGWKTVLIQLVDLSAVAEKSHVEMHEQERTSAPLSRSFCWVACEAKEHPQDIPLLFLPKEFHKVMTRQLKYSQKVQQAQKLYRGERFASDHHEC